MLLIESEGTSTPSTCILTDSVTLDLSTYDVFSFTSAITVATPSAKTSNAYDDTDETISFAAAHGFITGLKVQLTSSGTLPTGLELATDYFIIVVDTDTIMLASSYANAIAGTEVTFADDGTGNITVTPVALAGGTFVVSWSNDGTNFVQATSTAVTATVVLGVQVSPIPYKYLKITWTVTAGYLTMSNYYVGKVTS